MFYLIRTPGWLKRLYPGRLWEVEDTGTNLYLTFDDGPQPGITEFVLDELKKYDAKATFFCIGKNVLAYPGLYSRIIEEGHAVGNHSFDHLNGWKTPDKEYMENISKAALYIDSKLFRPPYGRITRFQENLLKEAKFKMKTVMWTVLSADFDPSVSGNDCVQHVLLNAREGSIVVFHDSEKASKNLQFALPKILGYFSGKGYSFRKLTEDLVQ